MIDDARELDDGAVLQAGLCIVGAGAAGITLALEYAGTGVEVLGYWQPDPAVINNDTMCVLTKAKSPVLAHLFINELLDKTNAQTNFEFVGYQPAIEGLGAQELIDAGLVPENLRNCVMTNDQIAKGYRLLQLSTDVEALWNDAWSKFRAGS